MALSVTLPSVTSFRVWKTNLAACAANCNTSKTTFAGDNQDDTAMLHELTSQRTRSESERYADMGLFRRIVSSGEAQDTQQSQAANKPVVADEHTVAQVAALMDRFSAAVGEDSLVVQVIGEADSNVILVLRTDDGRYSALIDSRASDEDPCRVRRDWLSAGSLYEICVKIGLTMQIPPHWYDPELGPYFPLWSRFLQ